MDDRRRLYKETKAAILQVIEEAREAGRPEVADYLSAHIHFDDARMTFRYSGDPSKFTIERLA